jgi:hypothetical protein
MQTIEIILNTLLITYITVYIVDISGFITSLSKSIYNWLNPHKEWLGQLIPKPFSCSLCLTFWLVLIYSLFHLNIIHSLVLASSCSILTLPIKILIYKINHFFLNNK